MKVVIYTHSSSEDVLNIQTDYLKEFNNKTLITNNPTVNKNYHNILYYDENLPYGKRLFDTISNIKEEYFLFTHEMDILVNYDKFILEQLFESMKILSIDKLDLKQNQIEGDVENIIELSNKPFKEWNKINRENIINDKTYLINKKDVRNYIYNVNPSIWKRDSLLEIMEYCQNKDYRTIEEISTQQFCQKFNFYGLHTLIPLLCGYYNCVNEYKFLHITHSNKYLSINDNNVTNYGQSYSDISETYNKIINKYNLKNNNRGFN